MTTYEALILASGWLIVIFVGLVGLIILWKIFTGAIDIKDILSEEGGKASLSRLQFLIFTFVIALSLFLVIIGGGDTAGGSKAPKFPPEIPTGIFALLGISGGTYVVAKGVSARARVDELRARLQYRADTTKA
jgi:hypothetical protein